MKYLLLFLALSINSLHAQKNVQGVIKDRTTKDPIAYVNIGVVNKNTGTVSASDGSFSMSLPEALDQETMKISSIGYKSLEMPVSRFRTMIGENASVYLEADVAELKPVVIPNRRLQKATLGNVLGYRPASAGFVNNVLGNEIGIPIKIKNKPTFIEAFHAVVDYNHYEVLKFRLNFYELESGLPGKTILDENIIVTSSVKKGVLTVDLSEHNIVAYKDIFVSIELIEGLGEGGLHFLADYDGPPVITRAVSQGKWNKQKKLSFGFTVSVLH
jgi:hypothetical protein